jgi:hypothetical protein
VVMGWKGRDKGIGELMERKVNIGKRKGDKR